ncbi:MAG: hypothetical protein V4617_02025 [Gemmatimonadota bacterium]
MPIGVAGFLVVCCLAVNTVAAHAQIYDPQKESPISLLVAPKDGVAYYELRKRAARLAFVDAAQAEPLIEQLVRDYPRDAENWMLLGMVKRGVNKPDEAAVAFEKARDISGLRREPMGMAAAYVAADDKRAALAALRRGIFEDRSIGRQQLFNAAALAPLRADPEFRAITGRPDTTGVSREEGWRRDLDYLYAEALRVSPDYRNGNAPAAFTRAYRELKERIPALSLEQFIVGLNRMLATLHQGHTGLFGGGGVHHLPVQFYVFPEGIFIVRAAEQHQELVGTRLVSIGRTSAEDALRLVNRMQSVDGDMEYVGLGALLLRTAEYLKGSGVDIRVDAVDITVESRDGQRRTVTLGGAGLQSPWKLPPPPRVQAPVFLRNTQESHWEQALPERSAVYVQFNQVRDDPTETLRAFGTRLWSVLEAQKPRNLILDLRHNTGGTTSLYPELLRTVIAYTRVPGRQVYALIGRTTYSAAANFITDLERLADPLFVGEASSECCNLNGDFVQVHLAHSGLSGTIAGVRWNLSGDVFDGRREMSPHVPVQLTAAAYFAGRDPALEAVFRLIDGIKR